MCIRDSLSTATCKPSESVFHQGARLELSLIHILPDLTVVTNDLHIASEVSIFPNATLLMVGGVVRKGFNSTYGYFAEKMLGSISVNKTFLSIDAVDMEQGLLSYITDDTNIKKQYIKSGKEVILLCDHTKFQASAFINISQLDCIHRIIVGKELDGEYAVSYTHLDVYKRQHIPS